MNKNNTLKKIKILYLYPDLMNLYGDWGNVAALERELVYRGCEVIIDRKSVGDDIDFDNSDFTYIGSGTERSQLACMRDLMRYKDVLTERINAEVPMLATGNSHELFGQAVTDSGGVRHEMMGLLDFETVQLNTRITEDCLCECSFLTDKVIGFINRAGGEQKGDIERPFSVFPREGAGYPACTEGIKYKNQLGTYLTGPVLVRNPPLLSYFADIIAGEFVGESIKRDDMFFEYQQKAYESALAVL
ncbi:MAG: glutamine amidotransferase [Oscillospiraceae bacterium]|nr:glutamine amidotransferase [Oscillospiraceae bacterium]